MTDNVVKAGIEDVLSSVKRLVSDDVRKAAVQGAGGRVRKPGRLVLTDALRISTPSGEKPKAPPFKLEPEYSAEVSAKPMLLRASDIVRAETAAPDVAEPVEVETKPDDLAGSLSAKIEALEAAIARTEDQWEPDGDSEDAYSGTPTQNLTWSAEDAFAEFVTETVEDVAEAELASTAGTFIRNPEVVASAEQIDKAPSSDRSVSESVEAVPDAEPVEEQLAVVVSEAEEIVESPDQAALVEAHGAEPPAMVMDEEALRELIAEVVRTELQGALGERITRNLRKMVRREIHRALAAQELE